MKNNRRTEIFLIVIILALILMQVLQNNKRVYAPPEPVVVKIPEKTGSSGVKVITEYEAVPVYVNGQETKIIVDDSWKKLYEEAKDSLEQARLFLESITINDYKETFVDNDTIEIDGYIKTRGELLEYEINYNIKPQEITYTPEVNIQRPKLSLKTAVEVGIPTDPDSDLSLKGKIGFENQKGIGFHIGYDTDNKIWAGVSKSIILKRK